MGVPFLLSGAGLAVAAFTAWRGGRLWWVGQAALPAWWAAAFAALVISLPEGPREASRLTTASGGRAHQIEAQHPMFSERR